MGFTNLYIQTEYSLLNSSLKLKDLINKAIEYKYDTLGICDINSTHGVIKFYSMCLDNGIKPIIGVNIKIQDNSFLLYAKNLNGYKNILNLSSMVNINHEFKVSDFSCLTKDTICILPGNENELIRRIINNEDYNSLFNSYKEIFNEMYFGVDFQSMDMVNSFNKIVTTGINYNIKSIPLRKTFMLEEDDLDVIKVLRCVDLGSKKYTPSDKEENSYFIPGTTFNDEFRKYPELLTNLDEISCECNLKLEFGVYKMPLYTIPDKEIDSKKYLEDLAIYGLSKRLKDSNVSKSLYNKYLDRLRYELDIISKMGFSDYFLIVYDFIKYARKNNILVGPGRGSAGGSLVAYSLGITEIDPIKFDLLFERFLNPERVSMPDIDTDFPDVDREEVIKYMGTRYGKERVAHISTFSEYGPRLAIRDIARVTDLDEMYLNELLKYVDTTVDSIDIAIDKSEVFKRTVEENDVIGNLVRIIRRMENLPRNLSIHAAGIIMADSDLVNYTGLLEGINGLYQTQFEASDLEKIGLVKIDFLGLRNLTMIDNIIKKIGLKDFNIFKIPLDDKDTFRMLASGDTEGIFQLESSGMTKTIMQIKCDKFQDIVDAIALFRPGPMAMIPSFCARKLGKEPVTYIHKDLEEILKPTYGAIVYQEQIMLIASKFAGFSLGEADVLRRAISKKKTNIMNEMYERFVSGAIKKGYDEATAKSIYTLIMKFADYGFNKSHSVAYAMVSYEMAYLKTHYFKEFIAVVMGYNIGNIHSIKSYIREANSRGIKVELPNVNKSGRGFNVEGNTIYYSLLGINGCGDVAVNNIISERENNGLYKGYDDFIARTKDFLSRSVCESLIYSGALDEFKIPRQEMILEYDKSLQLASYGGLFKDSLSEHVFGDDEFGFEDISNYERIALGFNLKFDIFKRYSSVRTKYKCITISNLTVGKITNVMFVIDRIRQIKTKKNDDMAFATLSDDTGSIDGVFFPKTYLEYKGYIHEGKIYIGEVKVDNRDGKMQLVINKLFIKK